jgi:large subunit ribosomal protein L3
MNKFILGKKVGMTQIFAEDGTIIPVTVIEAGPCVVIQRKTVEKDGYTALKVAYADANTKKMNKPEKGVFEKVNIAPKKYIREFKSSTVDSFEVGQEINVSQMFQAGDSVDVSGVSKGKGFQGNIKRHGQSGGKETHGSMYHRRVGSMGANTNPARVFKGKKLPGHMGMEKITVQNLNIVQVDGERNLLLVKGSIPGQKGTLVTVKNTVKNTK